MAVRHQFKRMKSDCGMPQKNPRDSVFNDEIRQPNRPVCVKIYVVTVPQKTYKYTPKLYKQISTQIHRKF